MSDGSPNILLKLRFGFDGFGAIPSSSASLFTVLDKLASTYSYGAGAGLIIGGKAFLIPGYD